MTRLLTTVAAAALALQASGAAWAQPQAMGREAAPLSLRSGFQPDPREVVVRAGGPRDSTTIPQCFAGYIPQAPSVVVDYAAGGDRPLILSVQSDSDTTLAVQRPDGSWTCVDDSEAGGLNPEVRIATPAAGRYAIHVGNLGERDVTVDATLRISGATGASPQPAVEAERRAAEARRVAPNPTLAPREGAVELRAGFSPDPRDVAVQAGGGLDSTAIREDCNAGYIQSAPNVRLNWGGGAGPLVLTAASEADVTLAVRGPNGAWLCNDDGPAGLTPQISIPDPAAGRYDVYVGRFGTPDDIQPATLRFSQTVPPMPEPEPVPELEPIAAPAPSDWRLSPTYGVLNLRAGFKPDPAELQVYAGGDRDASAQQGCNGVVTEAPSVRLDYRAGSFPLIFTTRSEADTTLMVRGPDGRFSCDDDSDGLNPRVIVERPRSGRYSVWVGRYGAADRVVATLRISEMVERPPTPATTPMENMGAH